MESFFATLKKGKLYHMDTIRMPRDAVQSAVLYLLLQPQAYLLRYQRPAAPGVQKKLFCCNTSPFEK